MWHDETHISKAKSTVQGGKNSRFSVKCEEDGFLYCSWEEKKNFGSSCFILRLPLNAASVVFSTFFISVSVPWDSFLKHLAAYRLKCEFSFCQSPFKPNNFHET